MEARSEQQLSQIENNDPEFTALLLSPIDGVHFDDTTGWERLGNALGENEYVQRLKFKLGNWNPERRTIAREHIEAFSHGLSHNRSIETISFWYFNFSGLEDTFQFMSPFFENNLNLQCLDFSICHLTREVLDQLCPVMRKSMSLNNVRLIHSVMQDDDMAYLISSLKEIPITKFMVGNNNLSFGVKSSEALADLLKHPESELKEIFLDPVEICDGGIEAFTAGLEGNNQLERLTLGKGAVTDKCLRLLVRALCFGNHTLEFIDFDEESHDHNLVEQIDYLLRLNRCRDKECVAIRKGLYYNFLIGKFDATPFVDMDKNLLPRTLPLVFELIGKPRNGGTGRSENFRRSAFFHFIRSMPMLVVASRNCLDHGSS